VRLLHAAAALLAAGLLWLAPRPALAVDDGVTDYRTIPAGSYLIDTGSLAPTVANAMRPYGLVFDLVRNQKVPVLWAISPSKAKDGVDFTNLSTGKAYRASAFIVEATSVTAATVATITNWRAQGVIVDGPTTADIPGVPIYDEITGIANVVSDLQNGSIAEAFMTRAGIPSTAYRRDTPTSLNACDDFFIMPHADPTWSSHQNLLPFVQSRGYIWSGCHAVSMLENIDNPGTPATNPDLNFLSTRGLVPFGSHGDGSPPYLNIQPGDPVMQFIGITDAAQQGGSEQIYLPKLAGAWRAGAKVLVYDTTVPADIPSKSSGPAAAIVYGRAFDVGSYGRVMYEGGHDVGGTAPANIAAQRAFLNFWLLALIDRSPDVAIAGGSITAVQEGGSLSLSSSVDHPFPIVSYQWTSSGGGSFSNPNSPTTSFTPPEVSGDTPLVIRVTVSDGCNRTAFDAYQVTVENLPKADLAIDKTGPALPVAVGTNFAYTLAVSNLGTEPAANVVVDDTLPAGLGFVSASGTGWTCSYTAGTRLLRCTRATLGLTGGTPSNITVNVTAPATPGSVTNTATVASDTPDLVPGNNTDSIGTTFLEGTDVSIVKTASAATVYAGAPFTYTLAVSNSGPLTATSLSIYDTLPAALAYVSATGSGWDCGYASATRLVTCFRASFAAGASAPITLTVVPSGTAGAVIANTARVASPDFNDSNAANNSSTVNVTLAANADLALTKTGSTTGGGKDDQVDTYVVTVTNGGPGTATGIVVSDVMSGSGVSKYDRNAWACTLTPSTGTLSPASPWTIAQVQAGGTWSIASLASGASATLTITCFGDNNDGVLNRASVTSTSYDPVTTNNSASAYVADGSVTTTDIEVTKSSTPATVTTGGTITYRITLKNLSTQDANNNHTVTDTLPAGTTYVGFANVTNGGTWSCTHSAGVVTCTTSSDLKKLGDSQDTRFFDITVTTPATPGTITNTASSFYTWGNRQFDPPANNTATATTTVIAASADVSVTKSVSNATPALGSNVTFSITARNNSGSVQVTGLRVQDLLPAGLEFISASSSQGSFDPYDPDTGLWYVGILNAGAQATLSIVARAAASQQTTNQACLYLMNQTDTNAANNCGTAVVSPQSSNLALAKTVDDPAPNLGANATFTVTLSNAGPSATTATTVVDQLVEGLEYVSHTASAGTFDAATGQWSIPGSLASGASVTLQLVAKVTVADTELTNTATIATSGSPDPDSSNNTASVTLTGQAADIEVTKAVDQDTPLALNTPLTFTVTATNLGPSDATGVQLTDLLPAGLAYQSHTAGAGIYTSGTGLWDIGALAEGASATLTVIATNTAFGTLVNTATRTASNQTDPDAGNDAASVEVLSGGAADLSLTKTVDTGSTYEDDEVTFTLQLTNQGPDPATGVAVQDLLPAGLVFVSASASQGSYDAGTGTWSVGSMASGLRVELLIVARADQPGLFTNTASVSALDQADPDATNDSASVQVDVAPAADLSVTKTGPGSATLGSGVAYTIVARNDGPSDVTGASLSDTVPAQVSNVAWTCVASGAADCDTVGGGSGASGSGNALSLGNVALPAGPANFLTLTVTGTAAATGTAVNTVLLSPPAGGAVFDPDISNNTASVTTVISNRRLSGTVFADTGAGGGTPNDGAQNGAEPGIAGVTLRLTDCASTVLSTATTDGAGDYLLAIPEATANGAALCVVETNLAGYVSTGGQPGDTGGDYDRGNDRVQFTLAAPGSYAGVDFGDVPENRFLTDGARTVPPGGTVTFPHVFVAGTGGSVSFATLGAANPDVAGWTEVLFLDADCDATLSAGDTPLAGATTVAAAERLCLLVQQFAPAGLPSGATRLVTVQAFFVYTNADPALSATYTRQDVTTTSDGALLLLKEVRNVTQAGDWTTSNLASPGDLLEYRITYSNTGSSPIDDLEVSDMTPAFTTFVAASCDAPLPASLTLCTPTGPDPGLTGAIRWQFDGLLQPASSGIVRFEALVQ
jgi:uncharacterized repeat protein (TIGR01451 family)